MFSNEAFSKMLNTTNYNFYPFLGDASAMFEFCICKSLLYNEYSAYDIQWS